MSGKMQWLSAFRRQGKPDLTLMDVSNQTMVGEPLENGPYSMTVLSYAAGIYI